MPASRHDNCGMSTPMTAGTYLRDARRSSHTPVPQMAMRFGQLVSVIVEIESDRRAVPEVWIGPLAQAYRVDATKLADLLVEQNAILSA